MLSPDYYETSCNVFIIIIICIPRLRWKNLIDIIIIYYFIFLLLITLTIINIALIELVNSQLDKNLFSINP